MEMAKSRWRVLFLVGVVLLSGCAGVVPDGPVGDAEPNSESPTPADGTLEMHYINVGQSVSTLIISPGGETMLVDTGHYNDDGEHVLQYLQEHDISRIDHLVTSHNDADHIGGNAAVIEYFETEAEGVGTVYDPGIAASTQTYGEYLDAIEQHDVTLLETREGDSVSFGDVDVSVLGPPEPYLDSEDRNENSIVLKFTHGETSILLSGDAELDQESYLVDTYGEQLQSTVVKAGHHGSSSSSNGAFLDATQPQAMIISSAYDSQYGHPHEEVLQRLADRSIPAYWTGVHGNIVLVSDGSTVSVQTQGDVDADPRTLRDADPIEPGTSGAVTERALLDNNGTTVVESGSDSSDSGTDESSDGTSGEELVIEEINADAEGDDRENLNDEFIVFENVGDDPIDLSGWTIEDEVGQSYTIPDGFTLDAGDTVTLRTGNGEDTENELYWGSGAPVWNNDGDTVIVTNDSGDRVLEEEY